MLTGLRRVVARSIRGFLLAGACFAAPGAGATWSIIIVDTQTGEIAAGSATCLTGFDLRANTPVLLTGVGAATAQSLVDFTGRNRVFIRDAFYRGESPDEILVGLSGFDASHQTKQYGIVDIHGRSATFSGTGASEWKGGLVGRFGPRGRYAYAVQGNILTGAPVVDMAVMAIESTEGTVADKLMAGMEAAQEYGGDGRCSCAGAPTSCGSPPVPFDPATDKSADIGYMMIARAGDTDRCSGIYRAGNRIFSVDTTDLDGDGLAEVLTGDRQAGTVEVLNNITEPGRLPTFANGQVISVGADPIHVELADVNADGREDLLTANLGGNSFSVALQQADGTFGAAAEIPIGIGPRWLVVDHLNADSHPDVLIGSTISGDLISFAGDGAGGFSPIATLATGGSPASFQVADLDGDGDKDFLAALINQDLMLVGRNDGTGVFVPDAPLPVGDKPGFVAIGDLNGDLVPDAVVSMLSGGRITVLVQESGVFTPTEFVSDNLPLDLKLEDLNGDEVLDIVSAQQAPGSIVVHDGNGDGTFGPAETAQLGYNCNNISLADFNGDGELDAALNFGAGQNSTSIGVVDNLGGGVFTPRIGCGAGEYYLNLNVAFQQDADADPVIQLRDLYDQWRSTKLGVPDAVTTRVPFRDRRVAFSPTASTTFEIELRDLDDGLVPDDLQVTVAHADGSAGVGTPALQSLGAGRYELRVSEPSGPGQDEFVVVVDSPAGPVTLMPAVRVSFEALMSDLNADGQATAQDFTLFLRAFSLGTDRADFNADGVVSPADFSDFIQQLLLEMRR